MGDPPDPGRGPLDHGHEGGGDPRRGQGEGRGEGAQDGHGRHGRGGQQIGRHRVGRHLTGHGQDDRLAGQVGGHGHRERRREPPRHDVGQHPAEPGVQRTVEGRAAQDDARGRRQGEVEGRFHGEGRHRDEQGRAAHRQESERLPRAAEEHREGSESAHHGCPEHGRLRPHDDHEHPEDRQPGAEDHRPVHPRAAQGDRDRAEDHGHVGPGHGRQVRQARGLHGVVEGGPLGGAVAQHQPRDELRRRADRALRGLKERGAQRLPPRRARVAVGDSACRLHPAGAGSRLRDGRGGQEHGGTGPRRPGHDAHPRSRPAVGGPRPALRRDDRRGRCAPARESGRHGRLGGPRRMTERLDPHGHAPAWAEGRLAPGGGPVQGQLEPQR